MGNRSEGANTGTPTHFLVCAATARVVACHTFERPSEEAQIVSSAATRTVGKAALKRLSGSRASPLHALMAAAVVGVSAAVVTYRLLRSGS